MQVRVISVLVKCSRCQNQQYVLVDAKKWLDYRLSRISLAQALPLVSHLHNTIRFQVCDTCHKTPSGGK